MKINSLKVRLIGDVERRPIVFNESVHFIDSEDNSKGKTTLIRLLLFSLGFDVPMTKGMDAKSLETEVVVERNDKRIAVRRSGSIVWITRGEKPFSISLSDPGNSKLVASYVFGIDGNISNSNLLGAFYIDQDNGWNTISAGPILGDLRYDSFAAIAALYTIDTSGIDREIGKVDREIKKCQLLAKAMEIKALGDDESAGVSSNVSSQSFIEQKIIRRRLQNRKRSLESKIEHLSDLIREKRNLREYIIGLDLMVQQSAESEPFKLSEGNFYLGNADIDGLRAQKMLYESEHEAVRRQLDEMNAIERNQTSALISLDSIESAGAYLDRTLQNVPGLDLGLLDKMIANLKREKGELIQRRTSLLSKGDSSEFSSLLRERFYNHLDHFHMASVVFDKPDIKPETYRNGGRFSGAELMKVALSYRLAFHECVCKKIGTSLPLIIDSPGSKELKDDMTNEIISYVMGYGRKHHIQVFVSTIKTNGLPLEPNNHHTLTGKALDLFTPIDLFNWE